MIIIIIIHLLKCFRLYTIIHWKWGYHIFQTKPFLNGIKLLVLLTSLGTPFDNLLSLAAGAGRRFGCRNDDARSRMGEKPGVTRPTRPTRQLVGGTTHLGKISDLLLD